MLSKNEVKMIKEIFPGVMPLLGIGIPDEPTVCYCVCGCTPSDPKNTDNKEDLDREGKT